MQSHKCQVEGNNHFPWRAVHAFADISSIELASTAANIPGWLTLNWMFVVDDATWKNTFWKKDVDLYSEMEETLPWGKMRREAVWLIKGLCWGVIQFREQVSSQGEYKKKPK